MQCINKGSYDRFAVNAACSNWLSSEGQLDSVSGLRLINNDKHRGELTTNDDALEAFTASRWAHSNTIIGRGVLLFWY